MDWGVNCGLVRQGGWIPHHEVDGGQNIDIALTGKFYSPFILRPHVLRGCTTLGSYPPRKHVYIRNKIRDIRSSFL